MCWPLGALLLASLTQLIWCFPLWAKYIVSQQMLSQLSSMRAVSHGKLPKLMVAKRGLKLLV